MNMQPGGETGRTTKKTKAFYTESDCAEFPYIFAQCSLTKKEEKMRQRWTKNVCDRELGYIHAADKYTFRFTPSLVSQI